MLPSLPDDARVWLFASNRTLSDDEQSAVLSQTRAFIDGWTSHGRPVEGVAEVHMAHVLIVGAMIDEREVNAGLSGCGIDSLTHALEATANELAFELSGALDVLLVDDESRIEIVSRTEFKRRAMEGHVNSASSVVDLSTTSVNELREKGIRRHVADSWHAGLLPAAETV